MNRLNNTNYKEIAKRKALQRRKEVQEEFKKDGKNLNYGLGDWLYGFERGYTEGFEEAVHWLKLNGYLPWT